MPLRKAISQIPLFSFWNMTRDVVILTAVFCLLQGNLSTAAPSKNTPSSTPTSDKELSEIRRKINTTSERAQQLENEANSIGQKINILRQDLVQAAKKIQSIEVQVYEKEDRLDVLNQQEKKLNRTLKIKYSQMAKTLAAMQRLSQQPAEMVAYRPDKAINSLRSASLLKTLQPELEKRAEMIRGDMKVLGEVRTEITQEREELSILLAALTSDQIKMNTLLSERKAQQKELRKATRAERQKLKQFAAKAQSLQDLIAKIEQETRARQKREQIERDRAAKAAAKRLTDKPGDLAKPSPSKSARLKLDSYPNGIASFRKAKGKLPLPAQGAIRRTFGTRTPEGQSSEGITIQTLPLAMVVSPHEGRIVFAGKFRSYGQLLIISHGPEYHTLLAGMTRLDAEVGQWVLKGEPIGQMASTSATASASSDQSLAGQNLYVELRQMGKPINPLPWIVARDRKVL